MQQLDKIFFGNTPPMMRSHLSSILKVVVGRYKRYIVPCVGQFASVKTLIDNGVKPSQIKASDVSLFSALLGYYYSGKDVLTIPYEIVDEENKVEFDSLTTDEERIAATMFWMKLEQVKDNSRYNRLYVEEFTKRHLFYRSEIIKQLRANRVVYQGMDYEIEDLRKEVTVEHDEDTCIVINPPAYKNGYTKMFDFKHRVKYNVDILEFEWEKEYFPCYEMSKRDKGLTIWYLYKMDERADKKLIVTGGEYLRGNVDFWMLSKAVNGVEMLYERQKSKARESGKLKIIPTTYEITQETRISFKVVDENTAMYYRELFAHKLGLTKAECYILMFLDGHIFGTVGFHLGEVRRLIANEIFEVYGFNAPLAKYEDANRLLMLAITSGDFKKWAYDAMFKTNRFIELESFKTTCLSKYRKVKLNNGILKVRNREKMKDGQYKIVYITNFREDSFKEVISSYLSWGKKEVKGENDESD